MSIENLPPELQARIASIMANQPADASPHQQAIAPPEPRTMLGNMKRMMQETPPPAIERPPSLMDHVIALRNEVQALSQQVAAQSQVTEAVGNAVGAMYEMFSPSVAPQQGYEAQGQEYTDQADY